MTEDHRAASAPAPVSATAAGVVLAGSVLLAPTSFTVRTGRALAVTGPNGSGKTTLLRVLAGRMAPTTGSVTVASAAPDERDPRFRARLAALLGMPPLARSLTLREHLVLVATSWGFSVEESGDRADQLLAEFGIEPLASRFPHELSSGQTQLFALTLTLVRPFGVLLLDEPEQRLDAGRLGLVAAILRGRVEGGATVVLASHSAALVERVADDVLALTESLHEPDG